MIAFISCPAHPDVPEEWHGLWIGPRSARADYPAGKTGDEMYAGYLCALHHTAEETRSRLNKLPAMNVSIATLDQWAFLTGLVIAEVAQTVHYFGDN